MIKRVAWGASLFVVILLWGLMINLPVSQVFRVVQLPPQVSFSGLKGTLFEGELERVDIQGFQFNDVTYQWRPLCLLKLSLCYQILADKDVELNLQRSLISQSLEIQNSRIPIDESIINRIPNLLVKPTGKMGVDIESLSFSGQHINDLNINLLWKDVGISGEAQVLGDLLMQVKQVEKGFEVDFKESEGLVRVTGDMKLNWDGQYAVDLILITRPGLNDSINSALELFSKKSGLNRYVVKQNGRLNSILSKRLKDLMPNK